MGTKRHLSSSPEPENDKGLKQPRLTSDENSDDDHLTPPIASLSISPKGRAEALYNPGSCDTEPAYDEGFNTAFENVKKVATAIVETLEARASTFDIGSGLERILDAARELQDPKITTSYIIGLVGDAGQGKSSTVNSLLECEGIAKIV